ncbi:hypothetical protein [Taibaiella chishuiensis]|uniref:Phospholipase/carboxylesterase n=1 Tax=Taibaiella chishuiensis TaxID=1434707 RepID=A0A2P8CXT1_9BACT|nr:hypothetical protein [Taibaiella chishuiensis]PSK89768.1 hypothetical protein B0I18_11067 [Taibaiella chishuiensis]
MILRNARRAVCIRARHKLYLLFPLLLCAMPRLHARDRNYRLVTTAVDSVAAEAKKKTILALSNDLFDAGTFRGNLETNINYRLLPPPGGKPGKYPLIVIFHNSGRIGTDNTAQLDVLVKYWAQPAIRSRYPAYVLAVQFPLRSSNYTTLSGDLMTSVAASCLQGALQLTDSLVKVLPVDNRRIYALGFSMGASTANNAMMARPGLFAAGVCISGIPAQESVAPLQQTPVWLVHGNKDTENPIPADKAWYRNRQAQHSAPTLFWEIEGLGHKIYAPLYTTEAIPEWLWQQHR